MIFSMLFNSSCSSISKVRPPQIRFFFGVGVVAVDNVDVSVVVTRTRIVRKNNNCERIDAIIGVCMCEGSANLCLEW